MAKSLDELSASKTLIRDILDAAPGETLAFDAETLQILLVHKNVSRELGIDAEQMKATPPVGVVFRRAKLHGKNCVLAAIEERTSESVALRRLHEAEDKCRALAEAAHEAVISADRQGLIRSWNLHAERVFGFAADEIVGQPLEKIMPARFRNSHAMGLRRFLETGVARLIGKTVRLRGRHKSGREIPLEASLSTWEQDGAIGFTGHLRDLSVQRLANRQEQHARRALTSLSRCNAALLQACSEKLLLDSICRLIVAEGGYPYVWVGFMGHSEGHPIHLVADASRNGRDVALDSMSWHDGPNGDGAAAQAIRFSRTIISQYPAIEGEVLEGPDSPQALGFLSCCAIPLRIGGKLAGAIVLYSESNDSFELRERVLLEDLACSLGHGVQAARTRVAMKAELAEHQTRERKLRRSLAGTTKAIFRALEARDPETANHQQRVARIAVAIGREMHLAEDQIDSLSVSSCLHDIGKLAVPEDLLCHCGELSEQQFAEIRAHTTLGFGLLQGIDFPWQVAEVALQHHEHVDGKGYPRGLVGDNILLEARIVAVADFVDAVSSPRRYRPARHVDETLKLLAAESGTRFDSAVVHACQNLFKDKRRSAHLRSAYL